MGVMRISPARTPYAHESGEPWLSDSESVALMHLESVRGKVVESKIGSSEKGLFGVFAIRYSIAVALAAL